MQRGGESQGIERAGESLADPMQEIARLEAATRGPEGARAWPSLAQAYRRAGRVAEAERVAREGLRRLPDHPAGRVALGLALLDQGRLEEARSELERVLDRVPDHPLAQAALPEAEPQPEALAEVEDDELERAFATAESDREEMFDADDAAAQALRAVEREGDEPEPPLLVGQAEPNEPAPAAPFRTHTMAELLERQGRSEEARRLRESLASDASAEPSPASRDENTPSPDPSRDGTVATLEGWLDNLRKGR